MINEVIKEALTTAARHMDRLIEKHGIFYFYADEDTIESQFDCYSSEGDSFSYSAEMIAESAEQEEAERFAEDICEKAAEYLSEKDAEFFNDDKNEAEAEKWVIDKLLQAKTDDDYDKAVEALKNSGAYEDADGNIRYEEDTAARDAWISSRGV